MPHSPEEEDAVRRDHAGDGAAPQTEATAPSGRSLSGRAKFAGDMGPLAVFFVAYFFGAELAGLLGGIVGADWTVPEGREMYVAIAAFMPAFAVAFLASVVVERRVAPMLLVTAVVLGVLGGLTLLLGDKTFFYMKPTITYVLFAGVLAGGLLARRNFLRILFDGALHLPESAWRTLTIRYAALFAVFAVVNEIAWRWLTRECDLAAAEPCPGESVWVQLKIFGFTGASLLFTVAQAPFLAKHMEEAPEGGR